MKQDLPNTPKQNRILRLIRELLETAKPNSASTYEVDNMTLRSLAEAIR